MSWHELDRRLTAPSMLPSRLTSGMERTVPETMARVAYGPEGPAYGILIFRHVGDWPRPPTRSGGRGVSYLSSQTNHMSRLARIGLRDASRAGLDRFGSPG